MLKNGVITPFCDVFSIRHDLRFHGRLLHLLTPKQKNSFFHKRLNSMAHHISSDSVQRRVTKRTSDGFTQPSYTDVKKSTASLPDEPVDPIAAFLHFQHHG